jgi:hypothetical protein
MLRRFFVKLHVDLNSGASVAVWVHANRLMVIANFSRSSTERRTCLKTDGTNEACTIYRFSNLWDIHNSWDLTVGWVGLQDSKAKTSINDQCKNQMYIIVEMQLLGKKI